MERGGSKTNFILYHFVSCLGSSSAEPGVIFGRLLKKVSLHMHKVEMLKKVSLYYTCTRLKCRLKGHKSSLKGLWQ